MGTNIESGQIKTRQVNLSVTGMTCSSCVGTIERSLNKIPGVRAAVNLAMESAHVIAQLAEGMASFGHTVMLTMTSRRRVKQELM